MASFTKINQFISAFPSKKVNVCLNSDIIFNDGHMLEENHIVIFRHGCWAGRLECRGCQGELVVDLLQIATETIIKFSPN